MNVIDHQELKDIITHLAAKKATGTPLELAKRLGVSERNLYRLISCLRDTGTDVSYSRTRRSYTLR